MNITEEINAINQRWDAELAKASSELNEAQQRCASITAELETAPPEALSGLAVAHKAADVARKEAEKAVARAVTARQSDVAARWNGWAATLPKTEGALMKRLADAHLELAAANAAVATLDALARTAPVPLPLPSLVLGQAASAIVADATADHREWQAYQLARAADLATKRRPILDEQAAALAAVDLCEPELSAVYASGGTPEQTIRLRQWMKAKLSEIDAIRATYKQRLDSVESDVPRPTSKCPADVEHWVAPTFPEPSTEPTQQARGRVLPRVPTPVDDLLALGAPVPMAVRPLRPGKPTPAPTPAPAPANEAVPPLRTLDYGRAFARGGAR